VNPKGDAGGDRKAPKQSQTARVLNIGTLGLTTNEGGIDQENKANSDVTDKSPE
jgi:hypothetical protein